MKTALYFLLPFVGIFFSGTAVSQTELRRDTILPPIVRVPPKPKQPLDFAISPGIAYQGQLFGELNLLVGHYENSMCAGNSFAGFRVGAETNFRSGDDFLFAPKIGFEISAVLICMRITTLTYFNGHSAQLRLLPEIGISVFCFANLTYGYSFPLTGSNFTDLPGHRFTLSFNLSKDLPGDL